MTAHHHNSRPDADLDALRARLAGATGPRYWRSLNELAGSEEFRRWSAKEFPDHLGELADPETRRTFLKFMGASLALAGVSGCSSSQPEKVVPYVRAPEQMVQGKSLHYASSLALGGESFGVVVESHMGRPTMIEGNALHAESQGAITALAQASILGLYDPDRSPVVTQKTERGRRISTWDAFQLALEQMVEAQKKTQGAGMRILVETVGSPTLLRQLAAVKAAFPKATVHEYEPIHRDSARLAAAEAFGAPVDVGYKLNTANVIVALDSDLLASGPGSLGHARAFADRRSPEAKLGMNRLYAVEPIPSVTGSMADHRWAMKASEVGEFARALAAELKIENAGALSAAIRTRFGSAISAIAKDLLANKGASVVVAGDQQPKHVHALALAINAALGNIGKTVTLRESKGGESQADAITDLAEAMKADKVELLLILGGNPVYATPASLEFEKALAHVKTSIHLSLAEDETSLVSTWHLPETHPLEEWSDGAASDGSTLMRQPLIAPLYSGKSAHELLAQLLGSPAPAGYDIVRETWKAGAQSADEFEARWRKAIHDGVMPGALAGEKTLALKADLAFGNHAGAGAGSESGLEIAFRPDPTLWDGRFANNGWLQELPKPFTKLTWANAAILSPATAAELGVGDEDIVTITYQGKSIEAPVWRLPGHADGALTVHFGHGRTKAGKVGDGSGFSAYALWDSPASYHGSGAKIVATSKKAALATTQEHHSMEGRNLVREGDIAKYREEPKLFAEMGEDPSPETTLYANDFANDGYAWGMAIDLNRCTGCSACMVACQAENNIPVVGADQVRMGREMHWINVDGYFEGAEQDPAFVHMPRLCMHCENAPCEPVCPVAATVHDAEGLNNMVYNRCVGTRYCGNNCPYKVRRFNFLQFADQTTPSLALLNNPDVTVRARGVMEKCSYCVQRINEARYQSELEDRKIRDGDIVTACQAACPAGAIVFGDIHDPQSKVSKAKADRRSYGLLTELNTRPRTTYLARLRNPNPEIERNAAHGA